ncbi:MAG: DUF2322 family protein [Burkholderiales bacterium]|nr:DUF2322 family protein [Burkholderiales bacterium]
MKNFAQNLKSLPSVENIDRIEIHEEGEAVVRIENRPGQAGSLAVYCHLANTYGSIHAESAERGLELYAEHVADARENPGKHPNIDRLFRVIAERLDLAACIVQTQPKGNPG